MEEPLLNVGEIPSVSSKRSCRPGVCPHLPPSLLAVIVTLLFACHLHRDAAFESEWQHALDGAVILKEISQEFYEKVLLPEMKITPANLFCFICLAFMFAYCQELADGLVTLLSAIIAGGFYYNAILKYPDFFKDILRRPWELLAAIFQGHGMQLQALQWRETFVGAALWLCFPFFTVQIIKFFVYEQNYFSQFVLPYRIFVACYAFLALCGNTGTFVFVISSGPAGVFFQFLTEPCAKLVRGDLKNLAFEEYALLAVVVYSVSSWFLHVHFLTEPDSETGAQEPLQFHAKLAKHFAKDRKSSVDRFLHSMSRTMTIQRLQQQRTELQRKQVELMKHASSESDKSWMLCSCSLEGICTWVLSNLCLLQVFIHRRSTQTRAHLTSFLKYQTLQFIVDRTEILNQSFDMLLEQNPSTLREAKFRIAFIGEGGVDLGGVTRDWFDSMAKALVEGAEDVNGTSLFVASADNTCLPRPLVPDEGDLTYDQHVQLTKFTAIGRFLALAISKKYSLPVPLNAIVCKYLLDKSITAQDVEKLDPDFYRIRVSQVMKVGGLEELNSALGEPLTFISAATEVQPEARELMPGGAQIAVTDDNKQKYVELLCEHYLCGGIRRELMSMLKGFWDIFSLESLESTCLAPRELAMLISGTSHIDPAEWSAHICVLGHSGPDIEFEATFLDVVKEMDDEDQAKLLHFATGSSRLPVGGLQALRPPFTVRVFDRDTQVLPSSHTCINTIEMPKYETKDDMKHKLLLAINEAEGFAFA